MTESELKQSHPRLFEVLTKDEYGNTFIRPLVDDKMTVTEVYEIMMESLYRRAVEQREWCVQVINEIGQRSKK